MKIAKRDTTAGDKQHAAVLAVQVRDFTLRSFNPHDTKYAFKKSCYDAQELIYLGFEWEVGISDMCKDYSARTNSFLKEALSSPLANYINFRSGGNPLEMVSIPATLKYHRKMMSRFFFSPKLESHVTDTQGCGIHVHIDKKAFTQQSLENFVSFISLSDNLDFINRITRRDISRCHWCMPESVTFTKDTVTKRIIKTDLHITRDLRYMPRYHGTKSIAVNTNSTKSTVELRIFNSTSKKEELFQCLEFADALTRYAKLKSLSEMYAEDFSKWIKENKRYYPYLHAFIK